ncbi:helix-turn-helix domain-containing protein [Streptomyces sp. NPDC049837]|uniref:helix-turn-helix domain-containing protein n=1 Tax=Streptomyces sp. NPDC049837 TaxID=3155277 RepID=UPI003422FB36
MDHVHAELGHRGGAQGSTAEDTRVHDPRSYDENTVPEKEGLIERTVIETVLRTLTCQLAQHHLRPCEHPVDADEQRPVTARQTASALLPRQGNDHVSRRTSGAYASTALRTLLDPCPVPEGPSALPPQVLTPLSHCAVTAVLDESRSRSTLHRLRRDNPHALIGDVGSRVILFSATPPVCDGLDVPYALAPVDNGDTASAARLARHTVPIAECYRVGGLDAREVLPLTALFSQSNREHETFLSHCLGPLHKDRRHAHLLATLSAYLRYGMCAATAARALFVHRHTLEYRLRRVHELTGLDLTQPLHRLRAELALLLTGSCGQTEDPPPGGHKKRRRKVVRDT